MVDSMTLPGTPPPVLADAYAALEPAYQAAIKPHLTGDTPSSIVSTWFSKLGHRVSDRTIRRYRQWLASDIHFGRSV